MNRHKLAAILMTPFLAIAGYFAAGYFFEQKPPMRTLISENECRILENACVLKTAGLAITLGADKTLHAGESSTVQLISSAKIDDVLVSFAAKNEKSQPFRLKESEPNHWSAVVKVSDQANSDKLQLRLLTGFNGAIYFAEENIVQ